MMVTLSGGPLAGRQIDGSGWQIGERQYLVTDEGDDVTYWRYDLNIAVFEGMGRIQ